MKNLMQKKSPFSPLQLSRAIVSGISTALFSLTVFSSVIMVTSVAVAAPADGPMATLKNKNGEVDKLLRTKAPAGSPEEKKIKDEIKSLAGTLFDYTELAKRAMADHWAKLSEAQRTEFVSVLRELIERRYVKQLRGNLEYKVIYKDEMLVPAKTPPEATVNTVVKVKTEGKTTDAEITYKMLKQANWLVYDVITDETSLVRTYKNQWGKIIEESGYPELIKKMKAKLAEPQ